MREELDARKRGASSPDTLTPYKNTACRDTIFHAPLGLNKPNAITLRAISAAPLQNSINSTDLEVYRALIETPDNFCSAAEKAARISSRTSCGSIRPDMMDSGLDPLSGTISKLAQVEEEDDESWIPGIRASISALPKTMLATPPNSLRKQPIPNKPAVAQKRKRFADYTDNEDLNEQSTAALADSRHANDLARVMTDLNLVEANLEVPSPSLFGGTTSTATVENLTGKPTTRLTRYSAE